MSLSLGFHLVAHVNYCLTCFTSAMNSKSSGAANAEFSICGAIICRAGSTFRDLYFALSEALFALFPSEGRLDAGLEGA